MKNKLHNELYTLSDQLEDYIVSTNSFGYPTPEFKFNTGICVGACDVAGYRSSITEKYWWEYFPGWDALGSPGARCTWLISKLQQYVETYNPHTILFVMPRLNWQGVINVGGKPLPLCLNSHRIIKFLHITRKIDKQQRDDLISWCNTFKLDDVIDKEDYVNFINTLKTIVGKRKFYWSINPTESIQDYWKLLLPKILKDDYMRRTYVEAPLIMDVRRDGSIGTLTNFDLAQRFKSVL